MPDASEVPALTATGLSCRFRRPWRPGQRAERVVWALRECELTLPAGRIAALVGPNGAGKSTLMRIAAGIIRPTAGEVRIFGSRRAPRERTRGWPSSPRTSRSTAASPWPSCCGPGPS